LDQCRLHWKNQPQPLFAAGFFSISVSVCWVSVLPAPDFFSALQAVEHPKLPRVAPVTSPAILRPANSFLSSFVSINASLD
jgi:hypothetical protein